VVDPDQVRTGKGDSITTPDVLRVQIRDVDILNYHILCSICNPQSLAFDHSAAPNPNDALIAADIDGRDAGLVVGDGDGVGAGSGIAIRAPVRAVDGVLAAVSGAGVRGGAAACLGHCALGADEVEFLVEDDDAGSGVGEPGLQLGDVGGILGSRRAATCCAFGLVESALRREHTAPGQ